MNENASEPNRFDQCVKVSTDVKSGNCSASWKSKNVVRVSGVLNKFVSVIGNNARPDARNVFVSLPFPSPDDEAEEVSDDEDAIIVLIIFFPGDDDDDNEDEEDARVFVDFLVASPGDDSDVTVALIADVSKVSRAVNFLWKYLKTCNHNE